MNGQKELQETVSFLKMMISCYEKKSTPRNPYKATLYSLNIALQCVEKQIPKKPTTKPWSPALCPTCRCELSESLGDGYYKHYTSQKVCDCGQKLDWSEE